MRNTIPTHIEIPVTWRQRLETLRYIPQLLKMVWQTSRILTASSVFLRCISASFPLAILWVSKLIIDAVVRTKQHQLLGRYSVWKLLALELLLVLGSDVFGRLISLTDSLLADLFSNHLSLSLMSHAATLDLASFEEPVFYDKMERARRQSATRLALLASLAGMGQQLLTLLSLLSAVIMFHPWLLLLLLIATIPVFLGETKLATLNYSMLYRNTPERRELDYLRFLGASIDSAKEVKVFGLGGRFAERARVLFERFYVENKKLAISRTVHGACLNVVPTIAYYLAYGLIVLQTMQGKLTIGSLAMVIGAFSRARNIGESLVAGIASVTEQSYFVKDLFEFFESKPTIVSPPGAIQAPRPIMSGFEFQQVSFAYPGSDREILSDVSFTLRTGERIALVGENGAGKTTLVKLLARLYDPTKGRILLDGVDLREYDVEDVRREIGVIFQDYVRYDMLVAENIGFGQIDHLQDEGRVRRSAEMSLASGMIATLPGKYRQMLGRRFEGGLDLSVGQWQKIALARAYMRDAQVLILDEPTASLDARAEVEMYKRFVDLTTAKMAIVISHRFSTLRIANRALVLERGRIVEQGSHQQLLAQRGKYAELFDLQAAGYR